jgi:hypothetical protein
MQFNLTKLATTFIAVIIIVAGFFTYSALGGTSINITLKTNPTLQTGLVGHWTFDGKDVNKATNVITDSSGQGNNGSTGGMDTATTTAIGVIGQAFDFDGSDDYVDIGNPDSLQLTTSVTVSAWISNNTLIGGQVIAGRGWEASVYHPYLLFTSGTDLIGRITTGGGTALTNITYDGLSTDTYYHTVLTYDGAIIKLYVDGDEKDSSEKTGILNNPSRNFMIGAHTGSVSDPTLFFNGTIDDVRIYNRALSADEVSRLHGLGATTHVNVSLKTSNPLEEGLVGHWTFDGKDVNKATNVITDSSGQGNHGSTVGMNTATTTAIGVIGQAFDLDGSDDHVLIPDDNSLDMTDQITVMTWIKPDISQNTAERIVTKLFSTAWFFGYDASGVNAESLDLYINGASRAETSADVLSVGQWNYVGFTYNKDAGGTDEVKIYHNGVVVATGDYSTAIGVNTQDILIGEYSAGGFNFDGKIDDVRIYNRALSASEVSRLYDLGNTTHINKTLPSVQDGLIGHWTFDGKDMIDNVADVSGQGNNGSLVGQTSTTTAIGVMGQALSFDDVDDYVTVADSSDWNISSGDFTISVWAKHATASSVGQKHYIAQSVSNDYYWFIRREISGNVYFIYKNGDNTAAHRLNLDFITTVADTDWHHIVLKKEGSTWSGYIDNVFANSNTGSPSEGDMAEPLELGRLSFVPTLNFDGKMDDIRIYNRALSADEITRLYNMGK